MNWSKNGGGAALLFLAFAVGYEALGDRGSTATAFGWKRSHSLFCDVSASGSQKEGGGCFFGAMGNDEPKPCSVARAV